MSMQRQAYSTKVPFYRIPNNIPYYMNLDTPGVLDRLQYRVKNKVIVYALRCQVNNMVYVGSSFTPGRRLYMHLIANTQSNKYLQADIKLYGLHKFTAYILEDVQISKGLSYLERVKLVHKVEQSHMDLFPVEQLYNTVRSVAKS